MKLLDLRTLQGVKTFMEGEKMQPEQIREALRVAAGGQRIANPMDAASVTPASVLGLAVKTYFPGRQYADRISKLLSTDQREIDTDLSLKGLEKYISPKDFLTMMAAEFPGYVFSHDASLMDRYPQHLWYSILTEAIYENDGAEGVSEIFLKLLKKIGSGKRNELIAIFKAKYLDLPESYEGMPTPPTQSSVPENPEVKQAQALLAVFEGHPIESIEDLPEPVRVAVLAILRGSSTGSASVRKQEVRVPADLGEQLEKVERSRAQQIVQAVQGAASEFEKRATIAAERIPKGSLTPRAIEISKEQLAGDGYDIRAFQAGGYTGDLSVEATEIGERLAARDKAQAQALVNLVSDALVAGKFRPDIPSRYSAEAVLLGLAALKTAPALAGYQFEADSRGGFTGGQVIVITAPKQIEPIKPRSEVEIAVDNLSETTVGQLEELMINRRLVGFATGNGQARAQETLALLDSILAKRGLFSRPVFAQYVEQLRKNVQDPPWARNIYSAYSTGLPDLN